MNKVWEPTCISIIYEYVFFFNRHVASVHQYILIMLNLNDAIMKWKNGLFVKFDWYKW